MHTYIIDGTNIEKVMRSEADTNAAQILEYFDQ